MGIVSGGGPVGVANGYLSTKTQRVERYQQAATLPLAGDGVQFGWWGKKKPDPLADLDLPPTKADYEKLVKEAKRSKRFRLVAYMLMALSAGSTLNGVITEMGQSARPVAPVRHSVDLLSPERLARSEAIRDYLQRNLQGVPGQVFNHYVRLAEYTLPRTVLIHTGRGLGTGFVYREDGIIVTNQHVVRNNGEVTVMLHNGREATGQVIATNPALDLAIIKVNPQDYGLERMPTLRMANGLRQGEQVMAIGNPLGYGWSITTGIVSSLSRRQEDGAMMIQTDTAINPGNSGGPLVNMGGEVVGVNTVVARDANGMAYSIRLDTLREAIPAMIAAGTTAPTE